MRSIWNVMTPPPRDSITTKHLLEIKSRNFANFISLVTGQPVLSHSNTLKAKNCFANGFREYSMEKLAIFPVIFGAKMLSSKCPQRNEIVLTVARKTTQSLWNLFIFISILAGLNEMPDHFQLKRIPYAYQSSYFPEKYPMNIDKNALAKSSIDLCRFSVAPLADIENINGECNSSTMNWTVLGRLVNAGWVPIGKTYIDTNSLLA